MTTHVFNRLLMLGSLAGPGAAAVEPEAPIRAVADNSFLVEEAYNQEPHVAQHIVTADWTEDRRAGPDDRVWSLAYTQEWPLFSQTHQVGFTVPYQFVDRGGARADGWGDLLLNYRWQAWLDEVRLAALAPRLSLVLPTGDARRGLGRDTVGFELNLPFSTALHDRWAAHFNAGLRHLPDAGSRSGTDLTGFHLGASLIYAVSPRLHALLEGVGRWEENTDSAGARGHEFVAVLSPGLRRAFNFADGTQLVLGVAGPVGLTGAAPDWGVFLYVSLEHGFGRRDTPAPTLP